MSNNSTVERNIIFFTCIAHAMTHVYIHLFTAIQPEIQRDFGLDARQLTELASISLHPVQTVLTEVAPLPITLLIRRLLLLFLVLNFTFAPFSPSSSHPS